MKNYIFISLLALTCGIGCGKLEMEHEHKGKIDVNVKIDLDNIKGYFEIECKEKEPDDVENCVNHKMEALLNFLSTQKT